MGELGELSSPKKYHNTSAEEHHKRFTFCLPGGEYVHKIWYGMYLSAFAREYTAIKTIRISMKTPFRTKIPSPRLPMSAKTRGPLFLLCLPLLLPSEALQEIPSTEQTRWVGRNKSEEEGAHLRTSCFLLKSGCGGYFFLSCSCMEYQWFFYFVAPTDPTFCCCAWNFF